MTYRVTHITRYDYSAQVVSCHNLAHLLPISCELQRCINSDIEIEPTPRTLRHFKDYFGNTATYFDIVNPHQTLTVTVVSEIELLAAQVVLDTMPWEQVRQACLNVENEKALLMREFMAASPLVPILPQALTYALPSFPAGRSLRECLLDLMARIHQDFQYQAGVTTVATPLEEVFLQRQGVCQDFAHLAIACVRALGLPACYISGYLETTPVENQPKLIGSDASHAWFAVYSPKCGWMELDPTNNCVPSAHHLRLARGRDYDDVTPLKGVLYGGGEHSLQVSVDVSRV